LGKCKVKGLSAPKILGTLGQVALISLTTLDALSHASYTYDAYGCIFSLSPLSAGQVVAPKRHLPAG